MSIQNINFLQSDNDTAYIPGITTYTASSIYIVIIYWQKWSQSELSY